MTDEEVKAARKKLARVVTDWETDGSVPANYVRRTGLRAEVARVDRWCGGFQDTHNPLIIGWSVNVATTCGAQCSGGAVLVADYPDVDAAITAAKALADGALPSVSQQAIGRPLALINSTADDLDDGLQIALAAPTAGEPDAFTL